MNRLIFTFVTLVFSGLVCASDQAREQRLAEQIEENIVVGEPLWLETEDRKFFAIITEAESEPLKGAVLLLHGMGAHPDWPDIISPLRIVLAENGWETLSIQLPVTKPGADRHEYQALLPDSRERIAAALAYLAENERKPVFIIAHSHGGTMGSDYLAQVGDKPVAGFIAVGLSADPKHPNAGALANIARIEVPILDLYGSMDLEDVMNSVEARAAAAKRADNSDYTQQEVADADHFFREQNEVLIEAVEGWLDAHR